MIKKQKDSENKITAALEEEFSRQLAETEDKMKMDSQSTTAELKRFLEETKQTIFTQVSCENQKLLSESRRLDRIGKEIQENKEM